MTFAQLSQATVTNQRFFHRTRNTFNRIQNSLMSIEIHDQGYSQANKKLKNNIFLAETSFCWAFSISTMIRHSLNFFLRQLAIEKPNRYDKEKIVKAIEFLNHLDFHKRLRNSCKP